MLKIKNIHSLLFTLVLIAVSACEPSTTTRPSGQGDDTASTSSPTAQAQQEAPKDPQEQLAMARQYSEQAQQAPASEQPLLLLESAEALYNAGLYRQAEETLARIDESKLSDLAIMRKRVLSAKIYKMNAGNPYRILELLNIRLPARSERTLYQDYLRLKADAYEATGNHIEAVKQLVTLETLLLSEEEREQNQQHIWAILLRMNPDVIKAMTVKPAPDTLSGWLEIAYLAKTLQNKPATLQQKLNEWQVAYGNHPASGWVLNSLMEQQILVTSRPNHIAVILPLSGAYQPFGQAIRDGILSAYYSSEEHTRITIRIYDETEGEIMKIYNNALDEGAQFVIGPVLKNSVETLAKKRSLPVPTLALNRVAEIKKPADNFYQFGLSPEDEGQQLAERIYNDGYKRVAIFYPQTSHGERIFSAFQQQWNAMGVKISAAHQYNPNEKRFGPAITEFYTVNYSKQRNQKIRALLGSDIKTEERTRQDIDSILVIGNPNALTLLIPHINSHRIYGTKVYSNSSIFDFKNPGQNNEFNGVVFCNMPWILDSQNSEKQYRSIRTALAATGSKEYDLHALGIDSYLIINSIVTLTHQPYSRYNGVTGTIYIDRNRWLHRELAWSYYNRGYPTPYIGNSINEQ